MKRFRAVPWIVAVSALAFAPACSNTAEGVKEDSRENAEATREGMEVVGDASRETARVVGEKAEQLGDKVAEGARDLSDAFGEGADDVGSDVAAGKETLDVKAALLLDKSIDASEIDVSTDAETRTVTLSGTVPTTANKAAAERIAREKAAGYRVVNLLTLEAV
jgi:osmotically-inducible protein OsmY